MDGISALLHLHRDLARLLPQQAVAKGDLRRWASPLRPCRNPGIPYPVPNVLLFFPPRGAVAHGRACLPTDGGNTRFPGGRPVLSCRCSRRACSLSTPAERDRRRSGAMSAGGQAISKRWSFPDGRAAALLPVYDPGWLQSPLERDRVHYNA